MNDYWLYLEQYTFVWYNGEGVLIYNSLSSEHILIKNTEKAFEICQQLNDISNMYCIEISDADLEDIELRAFIKKIRSSFSGDLINKKYASKKPLILPPVLNLQKDIERVKNVDSISSNDIIVDSFQELSIYINGKCNLHCQTCNNNYKQTFFCKKSDSELPSKKIIEIIDLLIFRGINTLNITGGNIFLYRDLHLLMDDLSQRSIIKNVFCYYKQVPLQFEKLVHFKQNYFKLSILVDFPINLTFFKKLYNFIESLGIIAKWKFTISSITDYEKYAEIHEKYDLTEEEIIPIYTGANLSFFKEMVFITKEDILSNHVTRREIFAKQVMNIKDFGKLTILSNGEVYANLNRLPLGTINDSIIEMLYKEMERGTTWRRIRDMKPCCDCIYQWLCPSPSNYEFAIGKPNLCHVNTEMEIMEDRIFQ